MTRVQTMMRRPRLSMSMSMSMRTAVAAAAMAVLAALTACATPGSPIRFHTVQTAVAAAPSSAYAGPTLRVRSVTVPAPLDRAELLQEVAAGQYEVREFDHWAAPLPQLARSALSEDLAQRLRPGQVVFPGASWPLAGADLRVDIQSFEVRNGMATMRVGWSLRALAQTGGPDPGSTAAPTRGAQWQLQVPAAAGPAELSQAFGRLLGQLADRIVAVLVD